MDCSIGFLFPVPEGGELSITAGGMTVGHVTCGPAGALTPSSPKGANHIPSFSCSPPSGTLVDGVLLSAGSIPFGHSTRGYWEFAPFGDGSGWCSAFRRFHSLRSFHPRLLRVRPLRGRRKLMWWISLSESSWNLLVCHWLGARQDIHLEMIPSYDVLFEIWCNSRFCLFRW